MASINRRDANLESFAREFGDLLPKLGGLAASQYALRDPAPAASTSPMPLGSAADPAAVA